MSYRELTVLENWTRWFASIMQEQCIHFCLPFIPKRLDRCHHIEQNIPNFKTSFILSRFHIHLSTYETNKTDRNAPITTHWRDLLNFAYICIKWHETVIHVFRSVLFVLYVEQWICKRIHERWKLKFNKTYISIWASFFSAFAVIVAILALKMMVNDNS